MRESWAQGKSAGLEALQERREPWSKAPAARATGGRHRIEISTSPVVGVVSGGDVADFLERHVTENFAVFEDGF
jgi:hypothetical protein